MSIVTDIAATYRAPGRIAARLISSGPREDRALAYLMGACGLMFVAQLPRLSRQAHLDGQDFGMLLGGALMGWVFIAPLFFYLLAWVSHLVLSVAISHSAAWSTRVALFWALLAATPLFLLLGLVLGFIGPGFQATVIGCIWFGAFILFWFAGLRQIGTGATT